MTSQQQPNTEMQGSSYLSDVDRLLSRVRKAREERKRKSLGGDGAASGSPRGRPPSPTPERNTAPPSSGNGKIESDSPVLQNHRNQMVSSPVSNNHQSPSKDHEILALIEESNRLLSKEFASLQMRRQNDTSLDEQQENMHLMGYLQRSIEQRQLQKEDPDAARLREKGTARRRQRAAAERKRVASSNASQQQQHRANASSQSHGSRGHNASLQLSSPQEYSVQGASPHQTKTRIVQQQQQQQQSPAAALFPHLHDDMDSHYNQQESNGSSPEVQRFSTSLEYIVDEVAENAPQQESGSKSRNHQQQRLYQHSHGTPPQLHSQSDRNSQYRKIHDRRLTNSPSRHTVQESLSKLYDDDNGNYITSPVREQNPPNVDNLSLQDVLAQVNRTADEIRSMSPVSSPRSRSKSPRLHASSQRRPSSGYSSASSRRGSIGGYRRESPRSPRRARPSSPRSRAPTFRKNSHHSISSFSDFTSARDSFDDDRSSTYSRRASLAQVERKKREKSTTFIPYSEVRHLQSRSVSKNTSSYNHSTMHWFLDLCSDKKMRDPSPRKGKPKRVQWVGLRGNGRADRRIFGPER